MRLYFEEAVNNQRPELVDSLFSRDYTVHFLDSGASSSGGAAAVRDFLPKFFEIFPDIHYTIDDLIAEDNRVVARLRANGTQHREFLGIPSSGGTLEDLAEIFIFRIEDGKIAEGWRLIDMHNLRQRLQGAGPGHFPGSGSRQE